MKSISVALKAHYASGATSLARLWRITRRDAVLYKFTDHDQKIAFGGFDYLPTSAYDAGAVQTSAALNVDDMSLVGMLFVGAITAADIEAGLWDGARVELSEVNYRDLSMGENILRVGELGEIQRKGQQFSAELRGLLQVAQNNVGRTVAASCDADFGDARCKKDKEALRITGAVTAAPDNRHFTASALGQATNYFRYGVLTWTSGLNAGLSMEVKAFTTGGIFELQLDMPHTIAVADDFTVIPGCDKTGRLGDCKVKFNNYVNFRGFEDLPGQDQILLVGGQ